MVQKYLSVFIVLVAAAVLIAGCTQPAAVPQQETAAQPVAMTVPFPPVPVSSPDGVNIAYELELKPADNKPFTVEKAEVIDPATGKVLYAPDAALLAELFHPASDPLPTAEELKNGTGKVPVPRLSLWFTTAADAVPDRLVHRLTINRSAAGLPVVTVTGGEIAVRKDLAPVIVGPPLMGPGWMVMETTAPLTHHFRAQITMDNVTRVPQRYAQDWVLLDPASGKAAFGDAARARDYYGFGKEIYAVGNGTISDASDGLPDFETIYSATGITIATAAGNYVVLDLGNGKYACYAHMVNGSVRVKKGDTVKEGQVIGLVGNSGNSDIPHLHFQVVTDKPSFLGAEGYPHVYRSFDVTGVVNATLGSERMDSPGYTTTDLWTDFGDLVTSISSPVHEEDMLPENNRILRFP
jgi:hypothetical protein